jgi:hypothetical protein
LEVLGEFFCFLFFFKALFGETIFLVEGYLLFVFLSFGSFGLLLDGALSLSCTVRLVSFRVSPSISHFVFPLHGYAMNRGGVLVDT